nr:MAG: DNA pilot protein [Microvirus sp.]
MADFNDIASFGLGLLGIGGGLFSNQQNIQSARESIAAQKEYAQNKYLWSVRDMRQAGLNPALAYQSIAGGSVSGATAHTENPAGNIGQIANSAVARRAEARAERQMEFNNVLAKRKSDNETIIAQANAAKILAETKNEERKSELDYIGSLIKMNISSADHYNAQIEHLAKLGEKLQDERKQIQAQTERIRSELSIMEEEKAKTRALIINIKADTRNKHSNTDLINASTKLKNLEARSEQLRQQGIELENRSNQIEVMLKESRLPVTYSEQYLKRLEVEDEIENRYKYGLIYRNNPLKSIGNLRSVIY